MSEVDVFSKKYRLRAGFIGAATAVAYTGLMYAVNTPEAYQHKYPSLSAQDSQKLRNYDLVTDGLLMFAAATGLAGLPRRRKSDEPPQPKP